MEENAENTRSSRVPEAPQSGINECSKANKVRRSEVPEEWPVSSPNASSGTSALVH